MALANIAQMSVAVAPGTGTSISLDTAIPGYVDFDTAGVSDGQIVSYSIEDGVNREVGRAQYVSASTELINRTPILSTAGPATPINATINAKVFVSVLKEDFDDLLADIASRQPLSQKGQANGYASLDGNGKVPVAQIPIIAATGVSFTPSGGVQAGNVQSAIQELDTKKVAKSGDTMTGSLLVGLTSLVAGIAGRLYVAIRGPSAGGGIEFSTDQADANGNTVGIIQWADKNSAATEKRVAAIVGELEGGTSNNRGGRITFSTKANNSETFVEVMRINSAQRVLIGTSSDNGRDKLQVSGTGSFSALEVVGDAGNDRPLVFRTGANARWTISANPVSETGSNVGSDFVIRRYNDAGVSIGPALNINRATGTMSVGLGFDGQVALTDITGSGAIRIGTPGRVSAGTPYIDFFSAAGAANYGARIIVSGGTAAQGSAVLDILAAEVRQNGQKILTEAETRNIAAAMAIVLG
jgi:hypothetical protein